MKKFAIMALALVLMFVPMQVKAAETLTLVKVKATYYKEVEGDGVFNRHDADGNLITSQKAKKALFEVNSTLNSGWGQATVGETFVKGTFKDVTIDNKGYLRCVFTSEAGTVYDEVKVKVEETNYKTLSKVTTSNTGNGDGNTSGNGDGNTSGNGDGNTSGNGNGNTSGNGDGNTSGNGDSDITYPGWTDDESSDSDETYEGWVD